MQKPTVAKPYAQKGKTQKKRPVRVSKLPKVIRENIKGNGKQLQSFVKYELRNKLGFGGFAQCYKAIELRTNQEYAIKVIDKHSDNMKKNGSKQRLENQISLMKKLDHQNILKLISSFQDQNFHFLVLELCQYVSLHEMIKSRQYKFHQIQVKYFIRQLVKALFELRSKNILHRDVKPSNILLNDKLVVKLGDFGLAVADNSSQAHRYSVCGTPNFMAPQILNKNYRYSFEIDMWSVGVITYLMLYGQHPFGSKSIDDTHSRIKNLSYTFPRSEYLSASSKHFIRKIFVLNPSYRLSPAQALSHQFLTDSIPKQLPIQCYHKQIPIKSLLNLCLDKDKAQLQTAQVNKNSADPINNNEDDGDDGDPNNGDASNNDDQDGNNDDNDDDDNHLNNDSNVNNNMNNNSKNNISNNNINNDIPNNIITNREGVLMKRVKKPILLRNNNAGKEKGPLFRHIISRQGPQLQTPKKANKKQRKQRKKASKIQFYQYQYRYQVQNPRQEPKEEEAKEDKQKLVTNYRMQLEKHKKQSKNNELQIFQIRIDSNQYIRYDEDNLIEEEYLIEQPKGEQLLNQQAQLVQKNQQVQGLEQAIKQQQAQNCMQMQAIPQCNIMKDEYSGKYEQDNIELMEPNMSLSLEQQFQQSKNLPEYGGYHGQKAQSHGSILRQISKFEKQIEQKGREQKMIELQQVSRSGQQIKKQIQVQKQDMNSEKETDFNRGRKININTNRSQSEVGVIPSLEFKHRVTSHNNSLNDGNIVNGVNLFNKQDQNQFNIQKYLCTYNYDTPENRINDDHAANPCVKTKHNVCEHINQMNEEIGQNSQVQTHKVSKQDIQEEQRAREGCQHQQSKKYIQNRLRLPYIFSFTDMSHSFGICVQLSNQVRMVLFNDNTAIGTHHNSNKEGNRRVVYIQYINRQFINDQKLFFSLLYNQGVISHNNQNLFTGNRNGNNAHNNMMRSTNSNKNIKNKGQKTSKYKIYQFNENQLPKNDHIISKYELLRNYCRTCKSAPNHEQQQVSPRLANNANNINIITKRLQQKEAGKHEQRTKNKSKSKGKSKSKSKSRGKNKSRHKGQICGNDKNKSKEEQKQQQTKKIQNQSKNIKREDKQINIDIAKYVTMIKKWAYREVTYSKVSNIQQRQRSQSRSRKKSRSKSKSKGKGKNKMMGVMNMDLKGKLIYTKTNRQSQYMFITNHYMQVFFKDGTKYFIIKNSAYGIQQNQQNLDWQQHHYLYRACQQIIVMNQDQKYRKIIKLPIRQHQIHDILEKKEIDNLKIVEKFINQFINQRRYQQQARKSYGFADVFGVKVQV